MIVGMEGLVLRTENAGADWFIQDAGTNLDLADCWLVNAEQGMIVTSRNSPTGFTNSKILKTVNGGDSWSSDEPFPDTDFNAMFFVDINTGVVVGSSGEIFWTTDGGNTWTPQDSGPGVTNLNGVALLDANVGVAVGFNGKIVETFDGGTSWVARPSGTATTFRAVSVVGF
jgi:photosystem II stability/assembly factor-like uncharacterized protein